MTTTPTMTPATTMSPLASANALFQKVFEATETAINNLSEGERISLKNLTVRVAAFLDLPQSTVIPFVSLWTKQHSDKCTVSKGRKGGIYKGKPVRKEDLVQRCTHCGQKLRVKAKDVKDAKNAKEAGPKTTAKAA